MTDLLAVKGLEAFYGRTQALYGVGLSVNAGGISALLGANGAGKTTTLRAISGLVKIRGDIHLDGERIGGLDAAEIARRGVAHVPDGRGTFTDLTVQENLQMGGYLLSGRRAVASAMERVVYYFPRLKERLRQQAGTLSGGEQQMLAIGRALMMAPRLILLDEPSFGLAPLIVRDIFAIMRRINAEERVSLLLVEQNASLALELAEHAYLLETGRIVTSGEAKLLADDEGIRRAYLGY